MLSSDNQADLCISEMTIQYCHPSSLQPEEDYLSIYQGHFPLVRVVTIFWQLRPLPRGIPGTPYLKPRPVQD